MYLARHHTDRHFAYTIRESYRDGPHYRSRYLFDLGPDPSAYIVYPGGNAFYIDEAVTDRLNDLGVSPSDEELEDIFWPFIDPRIRRCLESFRERAKARRGKHALSPGAQARIREKPTCSTNAGFTFCGSGAWTRATSGGCRPGCCAG